MCIRDRNIIVDMEEEEPKRPETKEEYMEDISNHPHFIPGGEIDEDGFYNQEDGSFFDPDGVYFNCEGYDEWGGYYDDDGVYRDADYELGNDIEEDEKKAEHEIPVEEVAAEIEKSESVSFHVYLYGIVDSAPIEDIQSKLEASKITAKNIKHEIDDYEEPIVSLEVEGKDMAKAILGLRHKEFLGNEIYVYFPELEEPYYPEKEEIDFAEEKKQSVPLPEEKKEEKGETIEDEFELTKF
eukprot:TRINITY_DN6422_c0_g1_i1.p2 TRINITY_DN6422_c0_g1~~TRINITY_DN6422_c0_g1_i1.p2  ORF type:complete len:240 (+),score=81.21 TRINITY_DN6422_c0_g1_i1:178-897(+)